MLLRFIGLFFTLIFLYSLAACSEEKPRLPVSKAQPHMGTYFTITSYDFDQPEGYVSAVIDSAFMLIAKIEQEISSYSDKSITAQINNQNDTERTVTLPDHAHTILESSLKISETTQGAFDVTLWPVFKLWDFESQLPDLPGKNQLQSALSNVNYQNLVLSDNRLTISKGQEIDFGGLSKGYAVEAVRIYLKTRGLKNFLIDASGNLGIEWNRSDSIEVTIRHPRTDARFWGRFKINRSCGIATSGDYHFYFMKDRVRYHHILDPKTGMPARPMVSATVIADDAMIADGLSTAVFVMGPKKGKEFIQSREDLEGILIHSTDAGELSEFVSDGIKSNYQRISDATSPAK